MIKLYLSKFLVLVFLFSSLSVRAHDDLIDKIDLQKITPWSEMSQSPKSSEQNRSGTFMSEIEVQTDHQRTFNHSLQESRANMEKDTEKLVIDHKTRLDQITEKIYQSRSNLNLTRLANDAQSVRPVRNSQEGVE